MRSLALLAVAATAGCGGTTGSALVTFTASASGPAGATGGPITFSSGLGARVTLRLARLHIGAVYLNQAVPVSGAASAPCILPGIYVGQVFGPVQVDLLSSTPQPFPVRGEGTETAARTAEVWLTGGDVNAIEDTTAILEVEGTAVQDEQTLPFSGSISIGSNRALSMQNPALPGANPICHQRIVTPIRVDLTPTDGGELALQVDPRPMFDDVDFTSLPGLAAGPPFQIPDTADGPGGALFKGMSANYGVYAFSWREARQ